MVDKNPATEAIKITVNLLPYMLLNYMRIWMSEHASESNKAVFL